MNAFDNSEFEAYKAEAQERWGKTDAWQEHAEKTKDYSKDKWNSLASDMDVIMSEFAACMKNGDAPDAEAAQNLVKKLQAIAHYSKNNGFATSSCVNANTGW